MSPLPTLTTASFDAELPFAAIPMAQSACTPQQVRETRLALRVLAAPVDSVENTDPLLQRLEAKLDLALEVSLLSRYPERPMLTSCRVGLDAIGWLSQHPYTLGEKLRIEMFPHADSALVLYLAATVSASVPIEGGQHQITLDILPALDEFTLHLWEKWVFRRHRRGILAR
ncbi:hypothetical protein [Paludibacterium purpuratum]|uniref:Atypical PilZ domain-containing cyclic di-GMP receptor n=1 Tax=Paludibacterium purpuratum TaxID=1144873 RepID=A0A4R7AZ97_9NEIS|nr:hypothetical protein [Paludibacterium purpuratum]TDR73586.1 hypothetical protein DFP86_11393 [Paludibacterium purpuratum]